MHILDKDPKFVKFRKYISSIDQRLPNLAQNPKTRKSSDDDNSVEVESIKCTKFKKMSSSLA
jgi:hypothetical protein